MKRITKIEANEKLQKKLRVAAYARVSTDSREQLVSLMLKEVIMRPALRVIPTGSMSDFTMMKVYQVQAWPSAMDLSKCLMIVKPVRLTSLLLNPSAALQEIPQSALKQLESL